MDVDGVLHPDSGQIIFFEQSCLLMARIVQVTGASVVVSSTWRKYPDKMEKLGRIFDALGLAPIHDVTPDFAGGFLVRDAEICDWLDRHPDVSRWIAIDDFNLVGLNSPHTGRFTGHFVQTDTLVGLQPQEAALAIQLLS